MSTTVTNYISNINTTFPTPGKDNPTQTFRSNWANITGALGELNTEVSHLVAYSVDVTNTTTSFFGHTVEDVNLKNSSMLMVDNGTQSGDVEIDYSLGNYQRITLTAGLHNITFINLPTRGKAGVLKLSIVAISPNLSSVNFLNTIALGPSPNPYVLSSTYNIFEVETEYSALDTKNTVFVKPLNELIFSNASVDNQISNNFTAQYPGDASANLVSSVSTITGSQHAMLVTSQISGNLVAGVNAMMPSIVKTTIVNGNWSSPTNNTATTFQVASTKNILPGATFYVQTTSTQLAVTSVGTYTVSCTPWFPTGIGTDSIIFKNPTFRTYGEETAFPTVAYMSRLPANTSTGAVNTYTGAIYASANRLEVTFAEPTKSQVNTFTIDTLTVASTSSDKSFNLANTRFVHQVLPYGSIIMWYGAVATIPLGWTLCNGSNSTPDLRGMFIIGAGGSYTKGDTGGSADAVVVSHNHGITEPDHGAAGMGHNHALSLYGGTTGVVGKIAGIGDSGGTGPGGSLYTSYTEYGATGITVDSAGVSGTGKNLPPYYAICYIMKITGA